MNEPQTNQTDHREKTLSKEILEIVISSVLLALGFGIALSGGTNAFTDYDILTKMILVSLITISLGFVLHELGHRFIARKYGYSASFSMWFPGLIISLIMSLTGWIIAAPGAVIIRGSEKISEITTKHLGKISIAGPILNLCLSIIFLVSLLLLSSSENFDAKSNMISLILIVGAEINAMLATFNLLPFFIFDGRKVFRWNKFIWFFVFALSASLFIGVRTAPSWSDNLASLGEPKTPTMYLIYNDTQHGFTFHYPNNWKQNTNEERIEYINEQDSATQDGFNRGAYTYVTFTDPTESGILTVRTVDYEIPQGYSPDLGETTLQELSESIISNAEDPFSISSHKTTIGNPIGNNYQIAWEIRFKKHIDDTIVDVTYVVFSHDTILNYTFFVCNEDAYDILRPAFDKFKETFTFK